MELERRSGKPTNSLASTGVQSTSTVTFIFHLSTVPVMLASLGGADCPRAAHRVYGLAACELSNRAQDFGFSALSAFSKLARSSAMLATILSLAIFSASACDLLTCSAICFV